MKLKLSKNLEYIVILAIWSCTSTRALPIEEIFDRAVATSSTRSNLTKRQTSNDISNKSCTTSNGLKGVCVPTTQCSLPELKTDFWKTLGYLCIIENRIIGICCMKQSVSRDVPEIIQNIDSPRNSNDNFELRSENRGCGITTKQFPRIVGGRPAEPDEWPWMAAIIRRGFPNVFCGGVLISDRHVMTAAHCTHKVIRELFVRLGEYDFRLINETRSRDFQIIDVKQHIDFDPVTYENDIALLHIDRPTIFNTYIWPICMPPPDENWSGWNGVVIGWGTQFFGGPHSNILMEVAIPIWQQNKCENAFLYRIGNNILCAGAEEGGRDSCQGDSGGPLLVQLPNRRWVVVGIVSWGLRCGEKDHPGLYTMVTKYIPWIIQSSTK